MTEFALDLPPQSISAPPQTHLDSAPRLGSFEVRLARTADEVRLAQVLRYDVFFEEGGASALPGDAAIRRDADPFDPLCDHLIVVDHERGSADAPEIVATTRLLRQSVATRHGGFYSRAEFELDALLARHPHRRFLEVGRSCVHPDFRNSRAMDALWRGIGAYTRRAQTDVMIGCASLEGVDPDRLAVPLSFLCHHARAPAEWCAAPLPGLAVAMDRMPPDAFDAKAAFRALPPLIRAYLRLGAYVGDGAVIDQRFGTVDVLIVLPMSRIAPRYLAHFQGRSA